MPLLALLCCVFLAACAGPHRILRGGAPCNTAWDNIDYKSCVEEAKKSAPSEDEAEGNIIISTVNGHSGSHGHHGHHR